MEYLHSYTPLYYIFIVIFSALISSIAIPSILHVARFRHLYDDLGHFRKSHDHGIPRLGGVAIFVGFTITSLLFCMVGKSLPINHIVTACIMLFAVGLKDDLSGVNSKTKFLIQFFACAILVILGDIRVSSMYGIFGIYELPYFLSATISVLFLLLVINAYNLIDGIDGLAGVTGIVANSAFASMFIYTSQYELAAVSLAMTGAIIGFLRFNITPAKIFMGDTGALLIGLITAVMAIKFMESNKMTVGGTPGIYSFPALTFATLIGPVFDTMRVFIIRIANGGSPFAADRNHIHHRMLGLGLNHLQTTLILATLNIVSIIIVFLLKDYSNSLLIILITAVMLLFNWTITYLLRSRERKSFALTNLFA